MKFFITNKKKIFNFFIVIFVCILISVSLCISSRKYSAYSIIDIFPNSNGHRAIIYYDNNTYAQLQEYSGYYVWDVANTKPLGQIKPDLFVKLFHKELYIYAYNDAENYFLTVSLNNINDGNSKTRKFYRDDITLPNVRSNTIKSIEIVSRGKKLFNPDCSMNNCKSDVTITDSNIIEKIVENMESSRITEFKKMYFDDTLRADRSYYVLATFKNAPEKLCFLIGGLKFLDDTAVIWYEQEPDDIEWEEFSNTDDSSICSDY